jgi:DNA repair protein RecO (recombination protein O)
MRTIQVEGIILKRRNFGEADRIITVFTREFGKMQIKAKGVRKIASKRSSHIEPLNRSSLSLYKGHMFPILTEATTIESYADIKEDLERIGFAYHLCELVDGLCPENQEMGEVFTLLQNVLVKLSSATDIPLIIHEFEVALLTVLGYWSHKQELQNNNINYLIEGILERKLKSRQILQKLI